MILPYTLLYKGVGNHELSTRKKEIDFDLRPWSLNINCSFFFKKARAYDCKKNMDLMEKTKYFR